MNHHITISLLIRHGVSAVVVCPGSRNAPIVHHLNESGMKCIPVTDERSAGFYAIGMSQATGAPVGVCVTSGTALLNLAPAVAEAGYRHIPLVVISADRPQAWIGQLDGQTLPQPGAFGCFARKSVTLPEVTDDESRWHCGRLVNEAMLACRRGMPVHINIPLSEPLFDFAAEDTAEVRPVELMRPSALPEAAIQRIADRLLRARRPMIVVGQTDDDVLLADALSRLSARFVVLREPLSPGHSVLHFDEVLSSIGMDLDYAPDFILYAGDTVVSKRLKIFMRQAAGARDKARDNARDMAKDKADDNASSVETWAISPDGEIHDTFMSQTAVIEAAPQSVLSGLAERIERTDITCDEAVAFHGRWHAALAKAGQHAAGYEPQYSQMMAVRLFEQMLDDIDYDVCVHYANSSAVRLACIYAHHYIYVNRGVNGIEGSLSTAAGFSTMRDEMTFCVIGDLSFFYDNNALWNQCLRGNLRILLLNNCGGGIFRQLPGLEASPVRDSYIAAAHHASAHGICDAHDIGYLSARNADELSRRMETFLYSGTHRPLVFEVFTDAEEDARAMREYYRNQG